MKIKITTTSHFSHPCLFDGISKTWTASKSEHVMLASEECNKKGLYLTGYEDHLGDYDHAEYPKFDDDGEQVSGATVATFEDAVAWFGHDVQSIKVEEIKEN